MIDVKELSKYQGKQKSERKKKVEINWQCAQNRDITAQSKKMIFALHR
jgi:hypothetical protein